MDYSDVVIVGGVAAGPKTAASLMRRRPDVRVTLFQKDRDLSYARCGLPYYASGDVNSLQELAATSYGIARDSEFFRSSKGFTVVTGAEVTHIDREARTVTVRNVETGEVFAHGYGHLVLATGAACGKPPFPVEDRERVRTFQTIGDAAAFRALAEQGKVGHAVIVGGGPVGCELAESTGGLWGIETVLIECRSTVLPELLDPEMAALVQRELGRQGVDVVTGCGVRSIASRADGLPQVVLEDARRIDTDYVFLALGVFPCVELAEACGLDIGPTGGIVTDERMATSDPHIYAGGDCVELRHQVTGRPTRMPMGSLANRHGRVIAENLSGRDVRYPGVLGALLVRVFDVHVGRIGLTVEGAREAGLDPDAVWGTFGDKPDYFPEARTIALKLVYEKGVRRLLGLQAVGTGDVPRRIDVFWAFLQHGGSVQDLLAFEHGYAPPYSEAIDPLHHLAAMVDALDRGIDMVPPGDLTGLAEDRDVVWLDVREDEEAAHDPAPGGPGRTGSGYVQIPLGTLSARCSELDRERPVIVICERGPRSYQAAVILKAAGFDRVSFMAGGLDMYCVERQQEHTPIGES